MREIRMGREDLLEKEEEKSFEGLDNKKIEPSP
jgi:hypothetical protein